MDGNHHLTNPRALGFSTLPSQRIPVRWRSCPDDCSRRTLSLVRIDPLGLCAGGVDRVQRAAAESGAGAKGEGLGFVQPDPSDGRLPGSGRPIATRGDTCTLGSRPLQTDGPAVEFVGDGSPRGFSRDPGRTGIGSGPRATGGLGFLSAASILRKQSGRCVGSITA